MTAISWGEMWHRQRVAAADAGFFDAALSVPAPPEPAEPSVPRRAGNDFAGDVGYSDASGLPSWQDPPRVVRPVTAMDGWAEERTAAGIHEAPDASAGNPRTSPSAWRII